MEKQKENKEREVLPDIIRGFAIILVVLGHCIQEGSGNLYKEQQLYFGDEVYQFIYSFHMPLFMMISGYLAWGSLNRANGKRGLLKKRVSSLLVPIFMWTAIDYIRILIINTLKGQAQPEALIFVYFYNALNNMWFLWAVFWCFFIVYVMYYYFKDSVIIYVLIFGAMFFLPDGLGLGAYKYMLPYYLIAFYGHKHIENKDIKSIKIFYVMAMGVIFIVAVSFFNEESFIYLTGYKLIGKNTLKQLYIDIYRFLVGLIGSCFWILIWKKVYELRKNKLIDGILKMLKSLGRESMGIYILSGYIIIFVLQKMIVVSKQSYILNFLETIVIVMVSYGLTIFLKRVPLLSKLVGK